MSILRMKIGRPSINWVDIFYISLMLFFISVPLLSYWGEAWRQHLTPALFFAILSIFTFLMWMRVKSPINVGIPSSKNIDLSNKSSRSVPFYMFILPVITIFTVAFFAYFIPMQKTFWHGWDDPMILKWAQGGVNTLLNFDQSYNRPFTVLITLFINVLFPDSVTAYLLTALILRGLTGVVLYGILYQFFPKTLFPLLAAVLFVANPAEPLRFMMIAIINYPSTLLFLIFSIWLYIYSYQRSSKLLLLTSCIILGIALLSVESAYPIALCAPILLLLLKTRRVVLWTWLFFWEGTVFILGLRFVRFLLINGSSSYQASVSWKKISSLQQILNNLFVQIKPTLSYASTLGDVLKDNMPYLYAASLIIVLLILSLSLFARFSRATIQPGKYLVLFTFICFGVFISVIAYYSFSETYRTQFFAEPFHGMFWALLLCSGAQYLPRFGRIFVPIVITGLLVGSSIIWSNARQDTFNPEIRFEKLVYIMQEVNRQAPGIDNNTLVLYMLDDPNRSPFGGNYSLATLNYVALGSDAHIANYVDVLGDKPHFTDTGIADDDKIWEVRPGGFYTYDKVVLFRITSDGQVILKKTFPRTFLQPNTSSINYDPFALIHPDHKRTLPFFHDSPWMTPFQPLVSLDVVPNDNSIQVGTNWYSPETWHEYSYRWAANDVQLIFDARTTAFLYVSMLVEPGPSLGEAPLDLQILDEEGRSLLDITVTKREVINFRVQGHGNLETQVRLHVQNKEHVAVPGDPRTLNFRVFSVTSAEEF